MRCALAHASTIIAPWGDHAMTTAAGQRNNDSLTAMDQLIDEIVGLDLLECIFSGKGTKSPEALLSLLDDSHYEATAEGFENWLLQKIVPEYLWKDAVIDIQEEVS